jgi:hypothetical protein
VLSYYIPNFGVLIDAIKQAYWKLSVLLCMVVGIAFGFVVGGHIAFGQFSESFSSFPITAMSFFQASTRVINTSDVHENVGPVGLLVFYCFVAVMVFLFWNVMIAIIIRSYCIFSPFLVKIVLSESTCLDGIRRCCALGRTIFFFSSWKDEPH